MEKIILPAHANARTAPRFFRSRLSLSKQSLSLTATEAASAARMNRDEALRRLNLLIGKDLRPLADRFGVPVWKNGRKNKGWAGHVLERYLGLAQNSRPTADFVTWDLKLVSLRRAANNTVRVKESMAIAMLEPTEVISNRFEDSHLYDKFRSLIVAGRIFENEQDASSILHSVVKFDLEEARIFRQVREDYELIRETIRAHGFNVLSADLGALIQTRTKGRGHGSRSRAFYARARFVAHMLNLHKLASMPRVVVSEENNVVED